MNVSELPREQGAEQQYALMRSSLLMYECLPAELNPQQMSELRRQVTKELLMQEKILRSAEAGSVVVGDDALADALRQLTERFASDDEFDKALDNSALSRDELEQALRRELRVDAVVEKILARDCEISEEELQAYYEQGKERLSVGETRTARHILLTINEEYAENSRQQVLQRIQDIAVKHCKDGDSFQKGAERFSECPTALHGGLIGRVPKGKLYPELDKVLFEMEEGGFSCAVESELGMHLLYCEKVHPSGVLPLEEVRDSLTEALLQRKRKARLREWLAQQ